MITRKFLKLAIIVCATVGSFGIMADAKQAAEPAKELKDQPYGTHERQKFDIFLPAGRSAKSTPVFFLIHGGGWAAGKKSDYWAEIKQLQAALPQMAFVSVGYRLADGKAKTNLFPTQEDDVKACIEYVINNRAKYGISQRFAVCGASAGAHLAMLYGYKHGQGLYKPAAVVSMVGPTNLLNVCEQVMSIPNSPNKEMYRGWFIDAIGGTEKEKPELCYLSSPINYVTPNSPTTLMLYGKADEIVPYQQAEELDAKLTKCGVKHIYNLYPGQNHGLVDVRSHAFQELVTFLGEVFDTSGNNSGIPYAWRTAWNAPPAVMRPLQIIHGGVVNYDTPSKMAYFRDTCGLGGIVCNVGRDNYLYNDDVWKSFTDAVRSAKSLGLRVWIYDEDGYPSPEAGGVVLRGHPELESLALVYDKENEVTPIYTRPAYEYTHASNNHAAGRRYPNPLHPETARRFLEVTHQQYRDRLGEELFAYVEAFFTDEPSLNAVNIGQIPEIARKDVRMDDPVNPDLKMLPMVAWCDDMPKRYREKYGEELMPFSKSLFEGDTDNDKRVRRQFWSLVGELNSSRLYGQIQEWCEMNGSTVPTAGMSGMPLRIASSGHTLREEELEAHTPLDGNKMEALARLDIPGMDMLESNPKAMFNGSWRAAVFPASAAWWTGRRLVMTEVSDFSETLHGKNPVDLKTMCATAAWQAVMGVTEFTLYYTIKHRDEATHKKYCDYVGRLNAILRNAKPVYGVTLYYPVAELQEEYIPHAEPLDLDVQSQKTKQLVANFNEAGRRLLQRQIPFVISDKKTDTRNSAKNLFVETPADVQKLPTAGLPKIAPENTWILLGRFERDGRDIFVLLNTDDTAYSGTLFIPEQDTPRSWSILDPATGEISSVGISSKKELTVKLQPQQALIYVSNK